MQNIILDWYVWVEEVLKCLKLWILFLTKNNFTFLKILTKELNSEGQIVEKTTDCSNHVWFPNSLGLLRIIYVTYLE